MPDEVRTVPRPNTLRAMKKLPVAKPESATSGGANSKKSNDKRARIQGIKSAAESLKTHITMVTEKTLRKSRLFRQVKPQIGTEKHNQKWRQKIGNLWHHVRLFHPRIYAGLSRRLHPVPLTPSTEQNDQVVQPYCISVVDL